MSDINHLGSLGYEFNTPLLGQYRKAKSEISSKNVFRISPEFKIAYSLVCDEIKNYHSTIELLNDGLGVDFKFKHILKDLPSGLDFNDHYYYQLCKKNNFVLITDDKDFWVEDIEIVTMSSSLLDRHIALLVKEKTD